jgi:hypothetical protein
VPSDTLESFQQRSVDTPCAELIDELVVIDRQLLPVARDGALYVPRRHDLLVCRRGIRRLYRGCRGVGAPAGEMIYSWVRQETSDHGSGDNLLEREGSCQLFCQIVIWSCCCFWCHFQRNVKRKL